MRKLNGLWRRFNLFMGVFSYLFLLHWTYVDIISPNFSYLKYTYSSPSVSLIMTVWGMALIPSFWLPIKRTRPSQSVYWLLYLLVLVPTMIIPLYTLEIAFKQLLTFDIVLLLSFAFLGLIYKIPLLVFPRIRISPFFFWFGFISISLLFYIYIIKVFGLQFHLLSFLEVYQVRSEYADTLSESGVLSSYLIDWQANVLNPFLMIFGLIIRKYSLLFFGILGQWMIYSITGYKAVFLSALFIFLLLLAQRKEGKKFGIYTVWGLAAIVLISYLIDVSTQTNWATSIFVRRLMVTPGLLTGFYFEFFSEHPHALLAHSIFEGMITYPYTLNPPNLIGYMYWGNSNTSANANVWADAYANFGLWGIFCFTIILGIVLWTYDCLSSDKNPLMTSLLLGMPALTLVDSALLTTIYNHGLGFALIFVYFLPKFTSENDLSQLKNEIGGGHRNGKKQSGPP